LRLAVALLAAVLLVSGPAAPAAPAHAADAQAYIASEEYFPSFDGTMLHAYVYRPAAAVAAKTKTPVILTVTPYANWGGDPLDPQLLNMEAPGPDDTAHFAKGYSEAVVELRGYGASGGCYDLYGPGEISDSKAAVEHFADVGWSTGKVGMVGSSYDGFTQIAALATRARGLAAVVAGAPPTGYHNFYMNGVHNSLSGHGFGLFYFASDVYPPGVFAPPEQTTNAISGGVTSDPACYNDGLIGNLSNDPNSPYWVARELQARAAESKVPTIWRQGFNDFQVRPTGFMRAFPQMRGDKIGIFGPWDHGPPRNGDVFSKLVDGWLDHYLLGTPMPDQPGAMVQSFDGTWRNEDDWPPHDAKPFSLPIKPGEYMDLPGNNGETGFPAILDYDQPELLPTGTGTWTFTQPLPYDAHFAGVPLVTADVSVLLPGAHIVGLLYDIDPKGEAQIVSRGVTEVASSGTVTFDLYPQDWRFAKGHRIGMLISGADDIFFEPPKTGLPVEVVSASYTLPFLRDARDETYTDGPFKPRTPHAPFTVDAETIAASTVPSKLPPPMAPQTDGK
jgi:uncharacterized protein